MNLRAIGAGMIIAMAVLVNSVRLVERMCPYCGQDVHDSGPYHLLWCSERPRGFL